MAIEGMQLVFRYGGSFETNADEGHVIYKGGKLKVTKYNGNSSVEELKKIVASSYTISFVNSRHNALPEQDQDIQVALNPELVLECDMEYIEPLESSCRGVGNEAAGKATIGGFEKIMFDIQCADPKAYKWIKNIVPKFWADASFPGFRYNHLTSNMAESFNAWILSAREKPIITMCEEIRVQLIKFEEKRELGNTLSSMLVPKAQELLDLQKMKAQFFHTVISTMDTQFEIHYLGKKHAVDLTHWTCSCRKWQLSGILCAHVNAAINHMYLDPTVYCLRYFTVEYFKRAFEAPFAPVPDVLELTDVVQQKMSLRTSRESMAVPRFHFYPSVSASANMTVDA
ncbi:uncharacterized protein LOC105421421 [Amborella trichopoda]|uniref:uncharacterized protein LOC105421421 n=1 Tax=Amborella trichopoda TaxID=13333 RepID=UPI0005D3AA94|nr:uncharacterized protein LOC105421421 [Amborella trichopoda]|eukprot:XP_011627093.1 uncharacterized protein LOC105421421 [Amborella trichopoda]